MFCCLLHPAHIFLLRIRNPDNNESVLVTVNDRGPFIRGRDLDLSYGAAKEIGLLEKGVGKVKIEYIGRNMRYAKRVPFTPSKFSGKLTIQVGSFIEQDNAKRLERGLEISYGDVYIATVHLRGRKFYRVRIGRFSNYKNAYAIAERLADEGYSPFITNKF
jgi:rare lipoprotein A